MKKQMIASVLSLTIGMTVGLTACGTETSLNYDYVVTFDYNVSDIVSADDTRTFVQYLGVKKDTVLQQTVGGTITPICPEVGSSVLALTEIEGYANMGWYLAADEDHDGQPDTVNGKVVLGQAWDFSTPITSDITLYADFQARSSLCFMTLDSETGESVLYKTRYGAIGESFDITTVESVWRPSVYGYTFVGYYADAAMTIPFEWPYEYKSDVTTYVYCKFIKGNWETVTTAEEFKTALYEGKDIDLQADLDFTDVTWNTPAAYAGEIKGNGHTISHISVNFTADRNNSYNFALFGTIKAQANIHDLSVVDASVSLTKTRTASDTVVALFAYTVEEGATFTDLTVSGTVSAKNSGGNASLTVLPLVANGISEEMLRQTEQNGCVFDITTSQT